LEWGKGPKRFVGNEKTLVSKYSYSNADKGVRRNPPETGASRCWVISESSLKAHRGANHAQRGETPKRGHET